MYSLIPSRLSHFSPSQLFDIERQAKDFSLVNGLCFRSRSTSTSTSNEPTPSDDFVSIVPLTLFPSPFSSSHFYHSKHIQPYINKLTHNISWDHQFLSTSLEKVIKVDHFTRKLYEIYDNVTREGLAQPVGLGMFRADYMMDMEEGEKISMKQIEVNTFAAGFGSLAPIVRRIHRQMMARYSSYSLQYLDSCLPDCPSPASQVSGMINAWEKYGVSNAVILFVVERRTINISDHRWIEFTLGEMRPDIKVIRKSLQQLKGRLTLKGNKQLFYKEENDCEEETYHEVGLIYFRTGYSPNDYIDGQVDWDTRLLMEQSRAIKCPNIQYHLAGVKKIQQIVADKSMLEKFLSSEQEVNDVFETFAGLWGLELNDSGDEAVEMALKSPERYVLKPQREGGGNNYYGEEVYAKLMEMGRGEEREAFILMEMIRQPKIANYMLKPDDGKKNAMENVDMESELGIFGILIGDGRMIVDNYEAGHVLRSKISGVSEGGVTGGRGAIDSPFLV